jgi:pilus assembly protein CpaC
MGIYGRTASYRGIWLMGSLANNGRMLRGRLQPLALAIALLALSRGSVAQQLDRPPTPPLIGGFAPRLPVPPPPADLPPATSFIDSLGEAVGVLEVKVGQGRFVTIKEDLAAPGEPAPFIAIGDPNVADFFQVGPRQLRLIGKRMGSTDLSVTTGSGKSYTFELQVVADLDVLRAQLRQMFPDAFLKLAQIRNKVIVEGQARDAGQVIRIVSTIDAYMRTMQLIQVQGQVGDVNLRQDLADPNIIPRAPSSTPVPPQPTFTPTLNGTPVGVGGPGGPTPVSPGAIAANSIATGQIQVINLIRVPTSQQVLLKVRVAELNRTAFREIGADFVAAIPQFGTLFGEQVAGNGYTGTIGNNTFLPGAARGLSLGSQATLFGTFSHGQFNTVINVLRRNNMVKILAEPNLIALNGYQATFLAGGEFPVPSFSGVGSGSTSGGGISGTQFKQFGVRLAFLPLIQDNDTIRLTVDPEVSTVDFSIGTTLVPGGSIVPGLNTRNAHTTVELKQGETLAIAGLLSLTLDGNTQKIPGLGDLPYIGAFFGNTSNDRIEKELVVTITPYIVEPMAPGQVPAGPGEEVREPNDLEFFFLNRIEGRTGIDKRSTTSYDDPLHLIRHSTLEKKYLIGPSGYSK